MLKGTDVISRLDTNKVACFHDAQSILKIQIFATDLKDIKETFAAESIERFPYTLDQMKRLNL